MPASPIPVTPSSVSTTTSRALPPTSGTKKVKTSVIRMSTVYHDRRSGAASNLPPVGQRPWLAEIIVTSR
jgi:hypothetical protein